MKIKGVGDMKVKYGICLISIMAVFALVFFGVKTQYGAEVEKIPAGWFWLGSGKWDHDFGSDEIQEHEIYVDMFLIYKTEVTNRMYAKCVAAGACERPCSEEINPRFNDPAYANHPVVYVTWHDAMDYCNWIGGRLPTEAEWEKAARGTDRRRFPWGDGTPTAENVNAAGMIGDTKMVGSYPSGASPYGVLDMGGNVREWVDDWYDETETLKVLKGGSYLDNYEHVRISDRLFHDPNSAGINRGFRCVIPFDEQGIN